MILSNQLKGTLYCFFGVLIDTPDALLLREVQELPNFVALFYRFLIFTLTMVPVTFAIERGDSWRQIKSLGVTGVVAGLFWGCFNLTIAFGIQKTDAANVFVITSSNPMFSALFGYIFLGEIPPLRTFIAALVCVGSIVLIFASEIGRGNNSIVGMFAALTASLSLGLYFVLIRLVIMRVNERDG